MSFSGNLDCDRFILENVDDHDIINICKISNKYIQKLCDEDFFRNRLRTKFNLIKIKKFIKFQNSFKRYYFYIIYWISKLDKEFSFKVNELKNDPKKYYEMLSREKENINNLLYEASKKGYIDIIKYSIENGATNFRVGMIYAYSRGQKEAFDYFLKLIADES